MKRFTKVLALAVVLSMTCLLLASCGISGTYKSSGLFGAGATELTFKGNKVTIEKLGMEVEAKYKVKGDKITIEVMDEDEEGASWDDLLKAFNGEHDFEKGDDYIKIGSTKYTKEK